MTDHNAVDDTQDGDTPEVLDVGHSDLQTPASAAHLDKLRIDPDTRIPINGVMMAYRDIDRGCASAKSTILTGILELGDFFNGMKDYLAHGEFTQWVQANQGFRPRTARDFMTVAKQYRTDSGYRALVNRSGATEISKLREMCRFDRGEVSEIIENGALGDIPIDDLHARSRRDLVDEIKKLRREKDEAEGDAATAKAEANGLKDKVRELAGERALDDRSEHARKTAKALEADWRVFSDKLANFYAEYLEEDRANFLKLDSMAQGDIERLFTGLHVHARVFAMAFEFAVMEPFGRPSVAQDITGMQEVARDDLNWDIPDKDAGVRVFNMAQERALREQGDLSD